MMPYYTVRIDDSDGNDNTVCDVVVEASDRKDAAVKVSDMIEVRLGDKVEGDGGFGFYYVCDCDIPEDEADTWECSHGGITVAEPHDNPLCGIEGPFEDYDTAYSAIPSYHVKMDVEDIGR